MVPLKMMLVLAFLLLVSVSAVPDVTIHSIKVTKDNGVEIEDDGVQVTGVDDLTFLDRARKEKAIFAIKKVESGFARTTNVGLTVQKGTGGTIHFRIRLKAVTAEQLALKAKLFRKSLTKAQKRELKKLARKYDGDLSIPWLKYIGIDLSETTKGKEIKKIASSSVVAEKLAIRASLLLKKTVAQKIEVKGVLKAKGVSFIPTTVFSFIRIAKVQFTDGSTTVVLSDHPGDTAAATEDGRTVVPSEAEVKIVKRSP